jgi:hypothetical protein
MGYPYGATFYNGYGNDVPAEAIIAGASNVRAGANPAFTAADFIAIYPQFKNAAAPPPEGYAEGLTIPDAAFDVFLAEANARLKESRWHSQWRFGMCNYIAHKATLYLQAVNDASAAGVVSSQSVGDVSISYDTAAIAQDLVGFGDLKATVFGQQLASAAKMLGKGGMMVW